VREHGRLRVGDGESADSSLSPVDETHGSAGGPARRLNEQIVRVAGMLPGGTEHEYGFTCECGCGETVTLSLSRFVEAGAWASGHDPK